MESPAEPLRGPAGRAAAAYRSVDRATRSRANQPEANQPLWLPAGWLAVVLMLTAAAPSFGAPPSADGWRARGTVDKGLRTAKPQAAGVRQVAYQDDLAGPALRTAGRIPHNTFYDGEYRVAQQNSGDGFGDSLRDSFERPFGVDNDQRPANGGRLDPAADDADRLFDDMPEEPVATPDPEPSFEDEEYDDDARRPGSIFDDAPATQPQPREQRAAEEEVPTGQPANSGRDKPLTRDDDEARTRERGLAMESCSEGLAELKANRLDSIDLSIRVTGAEGEDYPYVCSLDDGSIFAPRCWCEVTYMWKASGLCHKPLYFEDVHLERYGHSWGPIAQPILSGAHFFGSLPVLPYKMGLQAPNECVYALGYYRPGDCAPYFLDPIPFTWRAAIAQAGATVGVAAILP